MRDDGKIVNLLWTGGWDSTYRLVELSHKDNTVQPIYVYGEGRASEKYEIRAINRILNLLNSKHETRAKILPVEYIHFDTIEIDHKISSAYNNIVSQIHLGGQYEWLPSLALKYTNLEIGIEKAPPEQSGAISAMHNFGQMKYDKERETYLLDLDNSTDDLILLFKDLSFPIIEKTGEDMKSNIIKWGYEDVMKNIWMCFFPIFGKPCGVCNPCKSKMETNMEFLLPDVSKRRYENRDKKYRQQINKILRKISINIDKIRFR